MAFLLPNNTYVKLSLDGSFIIYKNRTTRNKEKHAGTSKEVLDKYNEIITELSKNSAERFYYDTDNFIDEYEGWTNELRLYSYNAANFITNGKYPLMSKYFPEIEKTIPEIINCGKIPPLAASTLEEVYNKAKKCRIFGEINEIKDV